MKLVLVSFTEGRWAKREGGRWGKRERETREVGEGKEAREVGEGREGPAHYSTQLATSYMCISIVSHFTVMFARGTCAS